MTGAPPQPHRSSQLPPAVECQGTRAGILCHLIPRATCPTIAKLQSTQEDNRKESGQRSVALPKQCLGDAFASGPHGAPNSAGTETSSHRQKQHLQLPAKFPLAHLIANWGKKNTTYPSFAERLPVLE